MRKIFSTILLFISLFLNIFCDNSKINEWGENGTVLFSEIEGGCWEILFDIGVDYEPVNLEEQYKIDSLRIRFEYGVEEQLVSYCMISEFIISITRIEKL